MTSTSKMQSPRGLAGSLVLLLGAAAAIGVGASGGNAELVFHFVLGTGFLLLALSVFDFRVPGWLKAIACAYIGALGAIFLLQGVSDLVHSEQLRHIAFDLLGQRVEKILGYAFIAWCIALLFLHSKGVTRIIGAVILSAVVGVEIYGAVIAYNGGEAPGALKLVSLLLFVWLLLESLKARPSAAPTPR